jgi:hypothetical protein
MVADLQPGEIVVAEKIDRISRLPLPEAERLVASIRNKGARLSVRVSPELKQAVHAQAKEAGVSVAEWVRIRREFEDATPANVSAFLRALQTFGANTKRTFERIDANHAAFVASRCEQPAREAAIRERLQRALERASSQSKNFTGSP